MTDLSRAAKLYRSVAGVAARMLAAGGATNSIVLRRSAATGEVSFPFSDIDILAIVNDETAASGAKLAEFYQRLRWVRLAVPRLKHVEVQSRRGLREMTDLDSFWASVERRTNLAFAGTPVPIPEMPVQPDDAVSRFCLWAEWFFPVALQMESGRNVRKTALECWNAFAAAEGLITEPALLRSDMAADLERVSPEVRAERLREPPYAAWFVFSLAQRLHASRLPALRTLHEPLMFEATFAPLSMRRLFVVVPRADSPLPGSATAAGAWPCTPEMLHLFLEYKNPFLYWSLPQELIRLGMECPSREQFLQACRYYGHERFLTAPGFASLVLNDQGVRLDHIEHALAAILQGRTPEPTSEGRAHDASRGSAVCLEYYRKSYDSLRSRSLRLQDVAASISA